MKSISSTATNVVLKITVPKWTGRKRKRGCEDPFSEDQEPGEPSRGIPDRQDAKSRLRSLRDNVGRYSVQPVGYVDRTHVFRGNEVTDMDILEDVV
jgi:general transcription factor 3C polypeptide 5 (transcription factor C subunit 1)